MTVDEAWNRFRASYPRREAWGRAEKAFRSLWQKRQLPALEILWVAIKCQQFPGGCLERVVSEKGRDLRPLPASWLNGSRWHDEYTPPLKEPVGGLTGARRDAEVVTDQELQDLDEQARQAFLERFRGKLKIEAPADPPPPLKPNPPPEDGWEFS